MADQRWEKWKAIEAAAFAVLGLFLAIVGAITPGDRGWLYWLGAMLSLNRSDLIIIKAEMARWRRL